MRGPFLFGRPNQRGFQADRPISERLSLLQLKDWLEPVSLTTFFEMRLLRCSAEPTIGLPQQFGNMRIRGLLRKLHDG